MKGMRMVEVEGLMMCMSHLCARARHEAFSGPKLYQK